MTEETEANRILVVCNAGTDLGLGHLTRSLALISALAGGTSCRLLIQGEELERDDLGRVDHTFIPRDADLLAAIGSAGSDAGVVVFDLHPGLLPDGFAGWAEEARVRGVRLVGIDSLLPLCELLDITWVPSLLVPDAELARCSGSIHYGWESFLITKRLPSREWEPGRRVLVVTGGSDVTAQAATLPVALDALLPAGSEVSWVRGPFGAEPAIPEPARLAWTVYEAPSGLDELIVESDYALTVFGVTLFELLQYGTPTVVFSPYDDRRFPEMDVVEREGAAIVGADAGDAVRQLAALIADEVMGRRLSRTASDRMAVGGADRLAELIHSLGE